MGVIYDSNNKALGFLRNATGHLPSRPGLGGTPGTPGFSGRPGRPGFSGVPGKPGRGGWSQEDLDAYFKPRWHFLTYRHSFSNRAGLARCVPDGCAECSCAQGSPESTACPLLGRPERSPQAWREHVGMSGQGEARRLAIVADRKPGRLAA